MKLKGTIILTTISLLERLSYYGVRAILVLYLTDPEYFNISSETTLEFYGYWTSALVIASIPFSLITDKLLGQKKSIIIGGFLTLIGYLLLIVQNKNILILSVILILAGTSLVKPSTTILIGRQFKKENRNRTLAYMIFFMGINIGAFFGITAIGYVGETYKWKYGFIIAAISTMLYLVLTSIFIKNVDEIETNQLEANNFKLTLSKSTLILPLLILINVIFWKNHETEISLLIMNLMESENQTFFGYEVLNTMIHSFSSVLTIPFSIVLFLYWCKKGVTRFFKAISFSVFLLILAIISTEILHHFPPNYLLEFSLMPLILYAIAEVIISPILTSYVTRISDTNYSNTIYSTYILITYLVGAGFVYLIENEYQPYISISSLALITLGIIVFKKKLDNLTYELK